jgi:transposase InsO family protein
MVHANAALTPRQRLRLACLVVEQGWTPARAAEFFHVNWRTADKWAKRYKAEGPAGMNDRSSARHTQHAKTPAPVVRKIVHLRWKQRLGPIPIGAKLGVPPSTVHAVLMRCRLNRLSHIDRVTGEPARRYERSRPGELIHVDVTKFGNIPDGGGWRFVGRTQGDWNRQATRDRTGIKARKYRPRVGTCFVHTVIDDYSRVAYAEIHDDEKAITAVGVLYRATAWFAERGVIVERVLSDNGPAYKSFLWRDSCADLGIEVKKTRPRRPQTNGKIERLHRTLADGWAYRRLYSSESARRAALPGWLHQYNHHRPHTALGGLPPITRLQNLAEHHS